MNVGFRPRLKARPSLYDLIKNRNIDRLSALSPTKTVDVGELPALPNSRPSIPTVRKQPELVHNHVKMAPKKEVNHTDEESEEQYGMHLPICCAHILANDTFPGSIFSVSGYAAIT